MPMVDYRTWYQQEQERRKNLGLKTGVGGLSENQVYQSYNVDRNKLLKAQGKDALEGAVNVGTGALMGGAPGAIIAAGIHLGKHYANSLPRAKKSFEQGDWKGGMGQVDILGNLINKGSDVLNLPDWLNPNYVPGKLATTIFHKPRTKIEEQRWKKLREAGFEVPKWVEDKSLKSDIYREDLGENFVGRTAEGNFVNNIFARSRNEADLRPEDLMERATNYEMFGRNWANADEETKRQILQSVLDAGVVREHKGTIDINWTPELLEQAQSLLGDTLAEQPQNQGNKYWVAPKWAPSRWR